MSELIRATHGLLMRMYREEDALFSYSAREAGDGIVNDFDHPGTLRYTINCFAGLQAAVAAGRVDWPVGRHLDRFLSLHGGRVSDPADRGLLLMVLARASHARAATLHGQLSATVADPRRLSALNAQDVGWMLMGLTAHAAASARAEARSEARPDAWPEPGPEAAGATEAADVRRDCERLFRFMDRRFLDKRSMLPRRSLGVGLRSFTTFGGIAYFLRALADYADAFSDAYADALFRESAAQAMSLQGERGEWPWFMDARRARVLDRYPVYSVHQDSMAMLFLLPALDRGVAGAAESIERSWRWLLGENELGRPMLRASPFFIDRSIRRTEPPALERALRYARAVRLSLTRSAGRPADPSRLTVLEECRSYHLGWILYVWSSRDDAPTVGGAGAGFGG